MSEQGSKHTVITSDKEKQPFHHYTVEWRIASSLNGHPVFVALDDHLGSSGTYLWPYEALNLLAWLQQEKPRLEQLAKEQQG